MRNPLWKFRKPIITAEMPLATDTGGTLILNLYRGGAVRWSAVGGRGPMLGVVDHREGGQLTAAPRG